MTAQVTATPGGSEVITSGSTIPAQPGVAYQIADVGPDGAVGPVLTPPDLQIEINEPTIGDLTVTLPDGTQIVFQGMVELFGQGTGIAGADGTLVVATLEDAIAAAAGGDQGGQAADGGGSSGAFNTPTIGGATEFGPGADGPGFDAGGVDLGSLPGADPNLILTILSGGGLAPPGLSVGPAVGLEDSPTDRGIFLNIVVSPPAIPGVTTVIQINGIPEGATLFNAGGPIVTNAGPGPLSVNGLSVAQLGGIGITPPPDSDADFDIVVIARSILGSLVATASETETVFVKAVADLAQITLDDLTAAAHAMGTAKNPVQIELEGRGDSGGNDSAATAQDLGAHSGAQGEALTVDGWLSTADPNDVDFYRIEIAADGTYTFDVDFGMTTFGARIDPADTVLSLFDAGGTLLATNDNFFPFDPGSRLTALDPQLTEALAAGTYFIAVSQFGNDPTGVGEAFDGGGVGDGGDYRLQVRAEISDVTPGNMFTHMVLEDNAQIQARVAVFDDPAFVDTGGALTDESDEIQASVAAFGHSISTFTGTDAPTWQTALANVEILVIPELESGNLGAALSAGAITAIQTFVNNGGKLIINGEDPEAANFLNAVFGLGVAEVDADSSSGVALTTAAAGTAFASAPDTLNVNDAMEALLAASLPANATSIYDNDQGNSVVTQFDIGTGQVFYLGWDWFDAIPAPGDQDGGWMEVLGLALAQAGAMMPAADQMYVDPTNAAFLEQRADIDFAVTDADGSESLTRIDLLAVPRPVGLAFDVNGDGTFDIDGDSISVAVTRFGLGAGTLEVELQTDPLTGATFFEIDPSERVQSIDLSGFSWKVFQHDDRDFAIEFTARTTETNPTEGTTLDASQVATPHAYQTTTIMVNVKAVADKPTISVTDTTVNEDNAALNAMNMFDDVSQIYTAPPMSASVTDTDGSESLTEVQLNAPSIISVGGEPTFNGVKISTIWSGQGTFPNGTLQVEVVNVDGNTVTVTATGAFNGQGVTLQFDPADRVQSVDLSPFGIELPRHKDGIFEIEVLATATETSPSEGQVFSQAGDTAVPDSSTVTSTIEVTGVTAPVIGLKVFTDIFHSFVADLDITVISPAGTRVELSSDNGSSGDNNFAGTLWDDAAPFSVVGIGITNTPIPLLAPEQLLSAFDGEDPNGTWTLEIVDDTGNVAVGVLDDWSLIFPSSGDTDQVAVASQTQSETFTLEVQAVADKAAITVADVAANEDNASQNTMAMFVDGTPSFGLPISAAVVDTDGSESITEIRIDGDSLPAGASFEFGGGPFVAFATATTATGTGPVQAEASFDGNDLVLTFDPSVRLQTIDISGSELSVTLPQHLDGRFAIETQVTTTETDPMGAVLAGAETAVQTASFDLVAGAVADKAEVATADVTVNEDNATAPDTGFEASSGARMTVGEANVVDAAFGSGPAEGMSQLLLTTDGQAGNPVSAADLRAFFGLAAGSLTGLGADIDDPTEGSGAKIELDLTAGDVVTFDWNFLNDDVVQFPGFPLVNDFAFAVVSDASGVLQTTLLQDTNGPQSLSSSPTVFDDETGFNHAPFSFTAPSSGTFTFGVGVVDESGTGGDSGLLIDNLRVNGQSIGMFADGTPTYGVAFSAAVTDDDGSESITEIRFDGDSLPPGASFSIAAGPVTFATGTALGPGTIDAVATIDGNDLVLTFAEALRLQDIAIDPSELGIVLPQHLHGSVTVAWSVTTTETDPNALADVVSATAVQSGSFDLTVEAVADKPVFTDAVNVGELGAGTPVQIDVVVSTPDQDGSEGLTSLTLSGLPMNSLVTFDFDGMPFVFLDGLPPDPADGSITVDLADLIASGDLNDTVPGTTFVAGKLVALDLGPTGFDVKVTVPAGNPGGFTATVTATSTEMDAPIAVASQTDSVDITFAGFGSVTAVDDMLMTDENAIIGTPLTGNLLTNDSDSDMDPLSVEPITPGDVTFVVPALNMVSNTVINALGAGEVLNLDVTVAQDISLPPFFVLFEDIGTFNVTVLDDGSATVTVVEGDPFAALTDGDEFDIRVPYTAADGTGDSADATAVLKIKGVNEAPVALDVNLIGYENEFNFGFPIQSTTLPATDEETILEALMFSLNGQGTIPAEAGISIELGFFPPALLNFNPVGIDDATTLTGASTYTVTDADGATNTASLTVTLRGNGVLGELIGSDDPDVVDIIIDNADFLTSRDSTLRGQNGDDRLFGDSGDDSIFGGDGQDFVDAGSGNDTVNGEGGDDFILGGVGNDLLDGGADNDDLLGLGGDDTLRGGAGNDVLSGGGQFDAMAGGFVDTSDLLIGGTGNDLIVVMDSGAQAVAVDTVLWEAGDADGSTDRVTGFDNDGADQDLLDIGAILTGFGGAGGGLSDFVSVSNDGVQTTVEIDTNGTVGGAQVDLTIILTDVTDGTLANLTDNIVTA